MWKRKFIFISLLIMTVFADAQKIETDSLRAVINKRYEDSSEVNALSYLGNNTGDVDSANEYAKLGLSIAKKLNYQKGKADCYLVFAKINIELGNIPLGMQYGIDALQVFREIKDPAGIATAYLGLQGAYRDVLADYRSALNFAFAGKQVAETYNTKAYLWYAGHRILPFFLGEIGQTYILMGKPDSALIYTQQSLDQGELFNGGEYEFAVYLLATIQNLQGKYGDAGKNYRKALALALQENTATDGFAKDTLQIYSGMSTLFRKTGELDSSLYYAHIVAKGWTNISEYKNLFEALDNLAQVYKLKRNSDSALKYVELSQVFRDSVFSREKTMEVQRLMYNESLKQQQLAATQLTYKNKVQFYAMAAGIGILLLIAFLLWGNNRSKQKAKEKIEKAYGDLKSTQAQLIQSEKMASLGELTAGIAHEIQNPLNFVNIFSDVSNELIGVLRSEKY
jgi:two-component system NtrC family sensor kinase